MAGQVIGWDRGRLARKRYEAVQISRGFFALRAICGRDARGPTRSLNQLCDGCFRLTNVQGALEISFG